MSLIKKTFVLLLILPFFINGQLKKEINLSVLTKDKPLPFGLVQKISKNTPAIGLALSGGGARGFAQIGVLKALKENNISIDIITSTSMGSIIGGLYSAGYSIAEIDSIAKNTDWNRLLTFSKESNRRDLYINQKVTEDKAIFSLRLNGFNPILPTALKNGELISNFLNLLILKAPVYPKNDFNKLLTKYRAVCTDLERGKAVVLKSGSLSQAMRASASVSFLLAPVKIDSFLLVDGGLVANVPVKYAKEAGADFVIAVNTTSNLHNKKELNLPWNVADQIVSIPMKILAKQELKKADIIITPELDKYTATDFSNIDSIINIGYRTTRKKINLLKQKLKLLALKKLKNRNQKIGRIVETQNSTTLEKEIINKHKRNKNVTSFQIKQDLDSLFNTGDYKSIKSKITIVDNNKANIKINYKLNSFVKKTIILENSESEKAQLYPIYNSLINKPYNSQKLLKTLIKTKNYFTQKGNSLATINTVKFDNKTGYLNIKINNGKLKGIKIVGNNETKDNIILREFSINKNGFLTNKNIYEGLRNLRNTNIFDNVVLTEESRNGENYLNISVQEKSTSVLRFGFRVDNENKSQFSLDLRDENILGSGTELGLLISLGNRLKKYMIEHRSNRIFNTLIGYNINLFYKFNDIFSYKDDPIISRTDFTRSIVGEYRQIFYGGSVTISTQIKRFGNVTLRGQYEVDEIKNKSGNSITPSKRKIVNLRLSSTVDTQNKYPYPTKGMFFNGYYETGQTIFGGDIGYIKAEFNYNSFITFGKSHTLTPKIRVGLGDNTLPLTKQYSLGGQYSFFGLRNDELRGRQLFLASIGYRYKLPFKLFFNTYIKVRYDLGAVWEFPNQIRFKDLRHGVGATVSFDTPIGPADFSVGRSFIFKRNLKDSPISYGETFFYFTLGYYF